TLVRVAADGMEVTVPVNVAEVMTVSGIVRYTDRLYGHQGYSGTALKSLRFVPVEAIANDQRLLSRGSTDARGHYSVNVPVGLGFKLRVLSATDETANLSISVRNPNGAVYAVTDEGLTSAGNAMTRDIIIPPQNAAVGAFNILDVFTSATLFMRDLESRALPALKAYWGTGSAGTYFCTNYDPYACPQDRGIYVLQEVAPPYISGNGDNDEFDDDVLWHEFGHFVMDVFSHDESPGGEHSFTSTALDLRLAFSEGWGDFFPIAVKNWLQTQQNSGAEARLSLDDGALATWYVDVRYVNGRSEVGSVVNIALPDPILYKYASNEIAVSKVLHELSQLEGMASLWPVLRRWSSSKGVGGTQTSTTTDLEYFWDDWRLLAAPRSDQILQMQNVLAERKIYYQADRFEPDNAHNEISLESCTTARSTCTSDVHNLYSENGSLDVDVLRFPAVQGQRYIVSTIKLSNGANTVLSVVNGVTTETFSESAGSLASKDRVQSEFGIINNAANFASSVIFTATMTTDYFVHVTRPTVPLAGTGRYGTYQVQVQPQ
ncbi:MAG: hypothetical protein OEW08_07710, partial [Gammaproteobacteria bacterium]|nr:hypothetical protein [Gammaproteobacteria bacterium]